MLPSKISTFYSVGQANINCNAKYLRGSCEGKVIRLAVKGCFAIFSPTICELACVACKRIKEVQTRIGAPLSTSSSVQMAICIPMELFIAAASAASEWLLPRANSSCCLDHSSCWLVCCHVHFSLDTMLPWQVSYSWKARKLTLRF